MMTKTNKRRTAESCRYLRAVHGDKLVIPPVWFMRQAGRYLPEYMTIRKENSFLEMCTNPEIACEIALQPIHRFSLDAAILFSDILIPLVPMGANLSFVESYGPKIVNPIRTDSDIERIKEVNPDNDLSYVLKTLILLDKKLPHNTALIGFAGAPFTLSSYWIEGKKPEPFINIKKMMYNKPDSFLKLQEKLAKMLTDYLVSQYKAGADCVQLFDTWAGVLSEYEYRKYNLSVLNTIFDRLRAHRIPTAYFVKDCSHLLNALKELHCDVIGLDWKTPLGHARSIIGPDKALQGNLDPTVLFADEHIIRAEVRRILAESCSNDGYIFNLGHGILPGTDPDKVAIVIDEIREGNKRIAEV